METIQFNREMISKFKSYLTEEEKSRATIEKYLRDIEKFYEFLPNNKLVTKEVVIEYKISLNHEYKTTSINSMLVTMNCFLIFLNLNKLTVKLYRIQKKVFSNQHKEISKQEYMRMLDAANRKENKRLYLLIQSICATGIRVSEHKYITVESIEIGKAVIHNKGKIREILFPKDLRKILLQYCKENNIKKGSVFITRNGKPIDRSNIWKMMKSLCEEANIEESKVFPHNLRHLIAFTYYRLEKDIVRLASILGRSSIETTRIYTMSNGVDCVKSMTKMGFILT